MVKVEFTNSGVNTETGRIGKASVTEIMEEIVLLGSTVIWGKIRI